MNNSWNQIIYKLWSPFYDLFFNKGIFLKGRNVVFSDITFNPGEKVLFVGCGTGADLEFVPLHTVHATAIDFSQDMLNKAKDKFRHTDITFLQMDAQNLTFSDETFDLVIASLLLSVVPDPHKCMDEIIRVARPNGRILIFDKFAPEHQELSLFKKIMRPLISMLGTDIGLRFGTLVKPFHKRIAIQTDEPIMLKGMYRKIIGLKL